MNRNMLFAAVCACLVASGIECAGASIRGWAVGNRDAGAPILCTTNGVDWFAQGAVDLPPTFEASSVAATRPGQVWVAGISVGDYTPLWHSADGGASWTGQGGTNLWRVELTKIRAVNDRVLWAVGPGGRILTTADGGGVWRDVSPGGGFTQMFQAVTAVGTQTAWVGGDLDEEGYAVLLRTDDGGDSWTRQQAGGITNVKHLLGLHAVNADVVWGIGGDQYDIIRTADGGAHWDYVHGGEVGMRDGNEIFVDRNGVAWAACDSTVFWSADDGATWSSETVADYTLGIHTPDGTNVWAVRNGVGGGIIYYSPDAGTTWTQQVGSGIPGLQDVAMVEVGALGIHVDPSSPRPQFPYASWETASRTLQEAVDAALPGETVHVRAGTYDSGERKPPPANDLTTPARLVIDKPVRVVAVDGPGSTFIWGVRTTNAPVRGVYMTDGSFLSGFTIENCGTLPGDSGGGVLVESNMTAVVSNCVIRLNVAQKAGGGVKGATVYHSSFESNEAQNGAAAAQSTLWNCTLERNRATQTGGATWNSLLYNCLLTGNLASGQGGGAYGGNLINCTVYGNRVADSARGGGVAHVNEVKNSLIILNTRLNGTLDNYLMDTNTHRIDFSCTQPRPPTGVGNTDLDPRFAFDPERPAQPPFYLLPLSPAINGGTNEPWMAGATDLAGNPRIFGGSVDMGAYEWQGVDRLPGYGPITTSIVRVTGVMDMDYRGVTTNMSAWRVLTIHNDGPGAMEVLRIRYPHAAFSGDFSGDIPPGTSTHVDVRFHPVATGYHGGLIHVDTYATAEVTGDDTIRTVGYGTWMRIPDAWLEGHGLETDTADDFRQREDFNDIDLDDFTVWEEWRAETDPNDPASYFRFTGGEPVSRQAVEITWVSATNRTYTIQRHSNLVWHTRYNLPFVTVATNIAGEEGTATFSASNIPARTVIFKVIVEDDKR